MGIWRGWIVEVVLEANKNILYYETSVNYFSFLRKQTLDLHVVFRLKNINIMNTKLTLSLNKEIIQQAKLYAKEHNISLSFLVENYLQKLINDITVEKSKKGSIVDELSGIIELDTDYDYKKEYTNYIDEKYK